MQDSCNIITLWEVVKPDRDPEGQKAELIGCHFLSQISFILVKLNIG